MRQKPQSFAKFWPNYLAAHANPTARLLHYVGTLGGTTFLLSALITGNWWLVLVGLMLGYACAWAGHFFVEGNTPLAFTNPLYSFVADYRMFGLALLGRLKR